MASEAVTELVNLYLMGGPMHGKVLKVAKPNPLRFTIPKPEHEDIQYGPEKLFYVPFTTFEDGSMLASFDGREQVTRREWKKAQEGIADDGR